MPGVLYKILKIYEVTQNEYRLSRIADRHTGNAEV